MATMPGIPGVQLLPEGFGSGYMITTDGNRHRPGDELRATVEREQHEFPVRTLPGSNPDTTAGDMHSGPRMIRRVFGKSYRWSRVAQVAASIALTGCGGSTEPTVLPVTAPGNYQLVTVAGQAVPTIMPGTVSTIVADLLSLKADGSFTRISTIRLSTGETSNSTSTGLYTFISSTGALSLVITNGGTIPGTITRNALSLSYANGLGIWNYQLTG